MDDKRRKLLGLLATGAAGAAVGYLAPQCSLNARPPGSLRPPGARPEAEFLEKCIRCGRCGPVCPTLAVRFADDLGPEGSTPYIEPDTSACILCMKCNQACPTGALEPIAAEPDLVFAKVRMGVAKIHDNKCWAQNSRDFCRACWYACPYPDVAIKLDSQLRPHIVEDACVGCGLCEYACPDKARAVQVIPA